MSVHIKTVAKELPAFSSTTAQTLPLVKDWLRDQPERFQRKVLKIFESAAVDKRYAIMSPEEVFTPGSFEEKNRVYTRQVKELGKNVLQKALAKAQWEADSLDYLVVVSCTGIMIPSLDAYL